MSTESEGPDVAALIATMDRPEFARRAIASVCEQTYDSLELAVVDASDDTRTEAVVSDVRTRYPEHEITYIHNDTPQGLPAARNQAAAATDADFLAFLDDDDTWRPTKIERQLAMFRSGEDDLGLVHTGYVGQKQDGSRASSYIPEYETLDFSNILAWNVVMTPSVVMVPREAFDKVGGFDEQLRYCADWDFYIRVARHYRFQCIPEPLVERTYHPNSMMTELDPFFEYRKRVLEKHEVSLAAHDLIDQVWKHHYRDAAEIYLEAGKRAKARECYRDSLSKAFDVRTVVAYLLSSTLPTGWVLPTLNKLSTLERRGIAAIQ